MSTLVRSLGTWRAGPLSLVSSRAPQYLDAMTDTPRSTSGARAGERTKHSENTIVVQKLH
jgi:hypothetical protein